MQFSVSFDFKGKATAFATVFVNKMPSHFMALHGTDENAFYCKLWRHLFFSASLLTHFPGLHGLGFRHLCYHYLLRKYWALSLVY